MAEFIERLTVEIEAETASFEEALSQLIDRIGTMESRIASLLEVSSRAGAALERLSSQGAGLILVAQLLERILLLMGQIAARPLVINVAPALAALQSVLALMSLIAARGAAVGAIGGAPTGGGGRVAGFASGGLVTGPPGLDRIPAFLSQGEFVVRREAVEQVGLGELIKLNQTGRETIFRERESPRHEQPFSLPSERSNPVRARALSTSTESRSSNVSTVIEEVHDSRRTEFHVHVTDGLDLEEVVGRVSLSEQRLRVRRG